MAIFGCSCCEKENVNGSIPPIDLMETCNFVVRYCVNIQVYVDTLKTCFFIMHMLIEVCRQKGMFHSFAYFIL